MPSTSGLYPPTPSPSIHSSKASMFDSYEQPHAGPSKVRLPYPAALTNLPPTPPIHDDLTTPSRQLMFDTPANFSEPRYRSAKVDTARRPHSTYPDSSEEPVYHPQRKYTDPTPQTSHYPMHEPSSPHPSGSTHQLDVDLDVYAQDYDVEDDPRQPTLSFVTTSTVDSTTSSPSISDAYTYGTERVDGKVDQHEPRIRVRANAGRQNVYSSAESSMVSGAYSYHAYSDNYTQHIPPMPVMPADVGLGLNRNEYNRAPVVDDGRNSYRSPSPTAPYSTQSWRPDMNRHRSNSGSTADTTDSASSAGDRLSEGFAHSFSYLSGSFPARQPWEEHHSPPGEANALAMVDDGRSAILDREKLEAMGGVRALGAMAENELLRLPRFTHLLLSSVGADILAILPTLLDVLSTTLVVLDVSHNGLTALPAGLQHCSVLEELNISGNPLRQLPSFIGDLTNLRMLVADNCVLQCLPAETAQLSSLHTLCIRSNRLVVLPPWLCLLNYLETLRIDNNPFAPQWVPIVAPILASTLAQRGHARSASQQSLPRTSASTSGTPLRTPLSSATGSTTSFAALATTHGADSYGSTRSLPLAGPSGVIESPQSAASAQSLRTTRGAGTILSKRPEAPIPSTMRAPNRSVTGPAPASEMFVSSDRFSSAGNPRRAQSSFDQYQIDESEHDSASETKSGKWGFLRKVSISRLRSEKERSAQLSASAAANVSKMPTIPSISAPTPVGQVRRPPMGAAGWSTNVVPTRRGLALDTTDLPPSTTQPASAGAGPMNAFGNGPITGPRNKRRSFLPIDPSPPSLNVSIPAMSPLMAPQATLGDASLPYATAEDAMETLGEDGEEDDHYSARAPSRASVSECSVADNDGRYARGLESIKSYLRDLHDLSLPALEPYGGFEVLESGDPSSPHSDAVNLRSSVASRHLTIDGAPSRGVSMVSSGGGSDRDTKLTLAEAETLAPPSSAAPTKRFKDDKAKRARVVREIYETEKTYVRGLSELVSIYVRPAGGPSSSSKSSETVIPLAERKVVFGGVESILVIHRDNFLPAIERAVRPLLDQGDDEEGTRSARAAHQVGEVFRTYIAYMKQYSTYINNFDNALSRMKTWTTSSTSNAASSAVSGLKSQAPGSTVGVAAVGASLIGSAVLPVSDSVSSGAQMTPSQRKRVKTFLKRCKEHSQHSQINLESYLLLPVQRVPRYKLLLEDLAMCTPPRESVGPNDALDDAIHEISSLASQMNEEKREAESRLRLLAWQQRISSRGPSPLVQPHRKLVLDGALQLIRVVKKSSSFVEVDTGAIKMSDGDSTVTGGRAIVPVDFIKPEPMDKPIMLILCSDMLVLVQKRIDQGWDGQVDLFSVLRMATLREPASVSSSNDRVLRVVDNKSIYYFNGGSHSSTLQWCRAINQQNRR